jgi:hypothetical protein
MNAKLLKKRKTLKAVKLAGALVASGREHYSCCAICRVKARRLIPEYQRRVIGFLGFSETLHTHLRNLEMRPYGACAVDYEEEDRLHRLMLIAMLHELVRCGDIKP